mgnify:CR=1 FL=1
MKKINITTIALLVYLIVMSIIGWPGNNSGNNYTEIFLDDRRYARHHHPSTLSASLNAENAR